jgi:tetratricopeptide (TPR) repeat protein
VEAQKNILAASPKLYNIESVESLTELADAYGKIQDYKNLVPIFEKLILIEPNNAQYHSTLAFLYKEIGDYKKAKETALKVLELSPESKDNVDEFLKSLPY